MYKLFYTAADIRSPFASFTPVSKHSCGSYQDNRCSQYYNKAVFLEEFVFETRLLLIK